MYLEKIDKIRAEASRICIKVLADGMLQQVQVLEDFIADYRGPSDNFIRGAVIASVLNINKLTRSVLNNLDLWIDASALLDELDANRKEVEA